MNNRNLRLIQTSPTLDKAIDKYTSEISIKKSHINRSYLLADSGKKQS